MGILDIFKRKSKAEIEFKNSMNDYYKELKKFKHLKKGELSSVTDADLKTAIRGWMWGKFNDDWSNDYEIIESLPKPCQDAYACSIVFDEICNGGLNQLFFNSTGQFAKMAQEGFMRLGSINLSHIMKEAIEIYDRNKEQLEKYNDGTYESFSESYNENLFNELDNKFSEEDPKFDSLLEDYIRKNESVFGD